MSKFYFYDKNSEICHTREYIVDMMLFNDVIEKEVYEAERWVGADMMYCSIEGEAGDKGYCGKQCRNYDPRNGKSGNCKFNRPLYTPGKCVIIKLKNLKK